MQIFVLYLRRGWLELIDSKANSNSNFFVTVCWGIFAHSLTFPLRPCKQIKSIACVRKKHSDIDYKNVACKIYLYVAMRNERNVYFVCFCLSYPGLYVVYLAVQRPLFQYFTLLHFHRLSLHFFTLRGFRDICMYSIIHTVTWDWVSVNVGGHSYFHALAQKWWIRYNHKQLFLSATTPCRFTV